MAYEFILTEHFDGVAVITLNRPDKLNALSFPLVRELDEALTHYEADDRIKAVILTGAGERAFSAGAGQDYGLDAVVLLVLAQRVVELAQQRKTQRV